MPPPAAPLDRVAGAELMLAPGEKDDGPADGVDPEQAGIATAASTIMVPNPANLSLARKPVLTAAWRARICPPPAPRHVPGLFPMPDNQKPDRG